MPSALLAFVFENAKQDIDRFRNAPAWRERFGDSGSEPKFEWTRFFEAVAESLLRFREDRRPLLAGILAIGGKLDG